MTPPTPTKIDASTPSHVSRALAAIDGGKPVDSASLTHDQMADLVADHDLAIGFRRGDIARRLRLLTELEREVERLEKERIALLSMAKTSEMVSYYIADDDGEDGPSGWICAHSGEPLAELGMDWGDITKELEHERRTALAPDAGSGDGDE